MSRRTQPSLPGPSPLSRSAFRALVDYTTENESDDEQPPRGRTPTADTYGASSPSYLKRSFTPESPRSRSVTPSRETYSGSFGPSISQVSSSSSSKHPFQPVPSSSAYRSSTSHRSSEPPRSPNPPSASSSSFKVDPSIVASMGKSSKKAVPSSSRGSAGGSSSGSHAMGYAAVPPKNTTATPMSPRAKEIRYEDAAAANPRTWDEFAPPSPSEGLGDLFICDEGDIVECRVSIPQVVHAACAKAYCLGADTRDLISMIEYDPRKGPSGQLAKHMCIAGPWIQGSSGGAGFREFYPLTSFGKADTLDNLTYQKKYWATKIRHHSVPPRVPLERNEISTDPPWEGYREQWFVPFGFIPAFPPEKKSIDGVFYGLLPAQMDKLLGIVQVKLTRFRVYCQKMVTSEQKLHVAASASVVSSDDLRDERLAALDNRPRRVGRGRAEVTVDRSKYPVDKRDLSPTKAATGSNGSKHDRW